MGKGELFTIFVHGFAIGIAAAVVGLIAAIRIMLIRLPHTNAETY